LTWIKVSETRLNLIETEFEAANVRIGEATWNTYSGEGDADLDGAYRQVGDLLTNRSNRDLIEGLASEIDEAEDPIFARRLHVWKNCLTGAAVDSTPEIFTLRNRLQERIAGFRFNLAGREVPRSELTRILRTDPNRENRRRAWSAAAALAEQNREDLGRLIDFRNNAARKLGYRDYVDFQLRLQDIDEADLHALLSQIEEKAIVPYRNLVGELSGSIGVTRLAPWDVSYAMRKGFQFDDRHFPAAEALDRLHATARSLGFDVESLPIRTLVKDIPFGGYNVAVRIPEDTRFLVNPSEGQGFYTTTFHEFGHSLQAVFTATPWPILKEYEWVLGAHAPCYSEGMAEVMGQFARRMDWLLSRTSVSEREVSEYRSRYLPAQMLVRFFDLLLNFRIELQAYSKEGREMAEVERELTEGTRLLEYPLEESPQWEANTWYTSYPVYWQNYILASVIASQVHEALDRRIGPEAASNPGVKEYLASHFFSPGNSISWSERIRRGTGSPLSPQAYLHLLR
jgi:oligoendopeptidase F